MTRRRFKDGTYSSSPETEYELGPNPISSQVFSGFDDIKTPVIVQIGSNDGVVGEQYGFMRWLDSLNDFKLFLCEPLVDDFIHLKEVYEKFGDKVNYCNFAITEYTGYAYMHLDTWCSGCSRVDSSGNTKIKTKSWDDFLLEYDIKNIDILLVDCEGYEWILFNDCINFNKISPIKIRYEYCHLNNQYEVDQFLISKGYNIENCQCDPTFNKVCTLIKT